MAAAATNPKKEAARMCATKTLPWLPSEDSLWETCFNLSL